MWQQRTHAVGLYVTVLVLFGVILPMQKGTGMFSAVLYYPLCCLAWIYTAPLVPQAFRDRGATLAGAPLGPGWIIREVGQAVAFGWLSSLLVIGLAILTVNEFRPWPWWIPRVDLLVAGPALGLGGATWLAGLGAWLGVSGWPAESAKLATRLILLAVLLGFALAHRLAPELLILNLRPPVVLTAAAVMGMLGLAAAFAATAQTRRGRGTA